MWKSFLVWLSLTMLTACQSASSGAPKPVSAGNLTEEYERSSAGVRRKYDGKEITVRGYVLFAAKMPQPGDDQGSVSLEEKGRDPVRQVTCWFSNEQAAEFAKVKGSQYATVKGIFNGEAGAELKFCKLVKVE
jgi:tRNA_anti-like